MGGILVCFSGNVFMHVPVSVLVSLRMVVYICIFDIGFWDAFRPLWVRCRIYCYGFCFFFRGEGTHSFVMRCGWGWGVEIVTLCVDDGLGVWCVVRSV